MLFVISAQLICPSSMLHQGFLSYLAMASQCIMSYNKQNIPLPYSYGGNRHLQLHGG